VSREREAPGLDSAYGLAGPEDAARFYRGWSASYDGDVGELGYLYPARIAALYLAEGGTGPVLDAGAGTGLIAAALPGLEVDGIDISADMLAVARAKGRGRSHIVADLLQPLPLPDAAYAGVVSAGTFTHGHVGPAALPELLRVARPGALFVLGIKDRFLDAAGFGSAFARLVAAGRIAPVRFRVMGIYADGATHAHRDDETLVAIFTRL
jgi:SAM-dependent methyltransferase